MRFRKKEEDTLFVPESIYSVVSRWKINRANIGEPWKLVFGEGAPDPRLETNKTISYSTKEWRSGKYDFWENGVCPQMEKEISFVLGELQIDSPFILDGKYEVWHLGRGSTWTKINETFYDFIETLKEHELILFN